ncbi:ABC transporter substrate-binding protein [Treponema brennaborense]|uniref:Extracellular solute-binding protein family 1 n=1 Tax=Treponema brennaborense (strain DSM 12168 / CIP 105900 / DD5/3) TaxID=906968 RepID=F4LJQ5_TREBD|nr:extracellular solute-binding protein [Treponema brennaborense]AEE17435.1 extracellular solute-binding protein family 1 [Treponema brennaborense DSM 12168]
MKKLRIMIGGGFTLITVALSLCLLCGCSGKKDGSGGNVVLHVLNYFDITRANATDEIERVWNAFSAQHPDIKVVREDLFNEPFHERLKSYVDAGQIPDVLYLWPSGRSSDLHANNLVKDLAPFVERDGLDGVFNAVALKKQMGGYLGELPNGMTHTSVLYANNAVLAACGLEPAQTYEELAAQVPVLARQGYETVLMANEEQWVLQSCLFSLLLGRFAGEYWVEHILSGTAEFTDPEFLAAFEFLKRMCLDDVIAKSTFDVNYNDVVGYFAAGRAAYLIDGDWRIGSFITDAVTGKALISPADQERIELLVFPSIPGERQRGSVAGICGTGWGMSAAIPAGSAKEEAAWQLIKWLESAEIQLWRMEKGIAPFPSRTDINTSGAALEPLQSKSAAFTKAYFSITPVFDGGLPQEVSTVCNEVLPLVCLEKMTALQAAQAIQEAADRYFGL